MFLLDIIIYAICGYLLFLVVMIISGIFRIAYSMDTLEPGDTIQGMELYLFKGYYLVIEFTREIEEDRYVPYIGFIKPS